MTATTNGNGPCKRHGLDNGSGTIKENMGKGMDSSRCDNLEKLLSCSLEGTPSNTKTATVVARGKEEREQTAATKAWEAFDAVLKLARKQAAEVKALLARTTNVRTDVKKGIEELLKTTTKLHDKRIALHPYAAASKATTKRSTGTQADLVPRGHPNGGGQHSQSREREGTQQSQRTGRDW